MRGKNNFFELRIIIVYIKNILIVVWLAMKDIILNIIIIFNESDYLV